MRSARWAAVWWRMCGCWRTFSGLWVGGLVATMPLSLCGIFAACAGHFWSDLMHLIPVRSACASLLLAALALPCLADSVASSASSAGSASIGSSSDSVKGSSNSSSGNTKVADGDYRVLQVVALLDRPGMLQITLQAVTPNTQGDGAAGTLWLTLPGQALTRRAVAAGDVVSARQRPYGLEFAHAAPREAFFLVLTGDWPRDLDPQRVTL